MDKTEFFSKYSEYKEIFENFMKSQTSFIMTDNNLSEAMKYSLFAGGKRIRPVLLLAYGETLGLKTEYCLPFALAIECIHTYSLIHDDLPALDNDVLRRGKPTNHVKFDEATAILAGDALLNYAFELLFNNCHDKKTIGAAAYIAECSGYKGMLSGQKSDIEMENSSVRDENTLYEIYRLKTGRLIACPIVVAEILAGKRNIEKAEKFGVSCGRLFQLTDDYRDAFSTSEKIGKSVGKDEAEHKLSAVALFGEKGVKKRIDELSKKLKKQSKSLDNTYFLYNFIEWISEL